VVLTLAPYTLAADGPDTFRNFVVTVPGTATLWVPCLEFRPRTRGVHHANIRVDPTTASRQLDAAEPGRRLRRPDPGDGRRKRAAMEIAEGTELSWERMLCVLRDFR